MPDAGEQAGCAGKYRSREVSIDWILEMTVCLYVNLNLVQVELQYAIPRDNLGSHLARLRNAEWENVGLHLHPKGSFSDERCNQHTDRTKYQPLLQGLDCLEEQSWELEQLCV